MGTRGWKAALAAGMVCLGLAGCGSGPAASSTGEAIPPASNLKGNWLLSGGLPTGSVLQPVAGMTATFDVIGETVTATMEVRTVCGSAATGEILGLGGQFLTGTAAPDGSFSVSTPESGSLVGTAITISGTLPKAPGAGWTGSYTINGNTGTCVPSGSGSLLATSVGELTGTYAGAGTLEMASSSGLGTTPTLTTVPSAVTLSLQQDGPLYGLSTTGADSEFAVNGSIQVSGVSCFSKGTASTVQAGLITGSIAQPKFTMDDGSQVSVLAEVLDSSATSLWIQSLHVTSGNCAGVYLFAPKPLLLQRE